jgi:hypothetical protein
MVVAEKGSLKLVEIADEQGATLDFIPVPEDQLRVTWRAPRDTSDSPRTRPEPL